MAKLLAAIGLSTALMLAPALAQTPDNTPKADAPNGDAQSGPVEKAAHKHHRHHHHHHMKKMMKKDDTGGAGTGPGGPDVTPPK